MTYSLNRLAVSRQALIRKRNPNVTMFNTLDYQTSSISSTSSQKVSNPVQSYNEPNNEPDNELYNEPDNEPKYSSQINKMIYLQTGGEI